MQIGKLTHIMRHRNGHNMTHYTKLQLTLPEIINRNGEEITDYNTYIETYNFLHSFMKKEVYNVEILELNGKEKLFIS